METTKTITKTIALFFILIGAFSACKIDDVQDYQHRAKTELKSSPLKSDFCIETTDAEGVKLSVFGNGETDSLYIVGSQGDQEIKFSVNYPLSLSISAKKTDEQTISIKVGELLSEIKVKKQAENHVVLNVYKNGKFAGKAVIYADFSRASFADMMNNVDTDKKAIGGFKWIARGVRVLAAALSLEKEATCRCGGKGYFFDTACCYLVGGKAIVTHGKDVCQFKCN